MEIIERQIPEEKCKYVYTLNTWKQKHLDEARGYLEAGYYVRFASTAIGHTLSKTVAWDGIEKAIQEFGPRLEVIQRGGWGWLYTHFAE